MFYAIVTSANDFFRECYGTLWNFVFWVKVPELYITCLMERNNYDVGDSMVSRYAGLVSCH